MAAPAGGLAAVTEFDEMGVVWQVGAGIGPETPGGLSMDQPGPVQPVPVLGGVSYVTAAQDDKVILEQETQPPRGQDDEETS